MAIIGYARVSSISQDLTIQNKQLTEAGCDRIFSEKKSGTNRDRPQLDECMRYLREGDQLVITKLDRIARSVLHLSQIADELQEQGVKLLILDQRMDTGTSTGMLLFQMLGVIAQFETSLRAERQAEGIANAKSKGITFGTKCKLKKAQIEKMREDRANGARIKDLCIEYSMSRASIYRLLENDPVQ